MMADKRPGLGSTAGRITVSSERRVIMDTDKQLYKLFTAAPAQAYFLLGLSVPEGLQARSETFKEVQTEADLVVEPAEEAEPTRLIEFHGYREKQFVPKVMLRCALYRMQHPARAIRCHIVYLDREYQSADVDDGGLFQPYIHYLPELFHQLKMRYPDSPLLSALRPLLAENEEELIATAGADYERIRQAPGLTDEQREAWLEVFHLWLMARLNCILKEIREMITKLPEIEDTPWGRELKERWTAEARAEAHAARAEARAAHAEALRHLVQRREQDLKHYAEMFREGVLPETAYRDLTSRAEEELQQYRADLAAIEDGSQ